jgi:hypothetical protein
MTTTPHPECRTAAVPTLATVPDLQIAPGALPPVRLVTLRAGSPS